MSRTLQCTTTTVAWPPVLLCSWGPGDRETPPRMGDMTMYVGSVLSTVYAVRPVACRQPGPITYPITAHAPGRGGLGGGVSIVCCLGGGRPGPEFWRRRRKWPCDLLSWVSILLLG